ncbi:hypothetical protein [Shewanella algae]|uniref:hypothetical protein n=1 Tax=Shewanella algae TaxID=38313 RepID=UPI0031F54E70
MTEFGQNIKFDWLGSSIRIFFSSRELFDAVKNKFIIDYGLRPVGDGFCFENGFYMILDSSVDMETFIRHLFTMSPKQYDDLVIAVPKANDDNFSL